MSKFGVYEAMGKTFKHKLDAFYATIPHGHYPHWNFNEEEFNKHSWNIEPAETISELYRRRAEQIRAKYDYVILSWSTGIDSQIIAESFLANGLHLDELVFRYAASMVDKSSKATDSTQLANEFVWALPRQLEKLKKYQPNINLTIWNWEQDIIDFWSRASNPDFINYPSINGYAKYKLLHICKIPNTAKNPVVIYGLDKPQVFYKNNEFYMGFLDNIMQTQVSWTDINNDLACEVFYWAPESAKLLIKQGHLVKQWFKKNPNLLWLLDESRPNRKMYYEIINQAIYPTYDTELWQANKPTSAFAAEFDKWFTNNTSHKATQKWQNSLISRSEEVKSIYKNSSHILKVDSGFATMPGCYSKFYSLGS